nr:MAG TPA: hypothetical protein [Caudoviricetes sp.]DAS68464.1 MAG TPA: hypothetical protein [Caudoviricetes sp.]
MGEQPWLRSTPCSVPQVVPGGSYVLLQQG